jgi:uncharacterized membrane protein
MVNRVTEGSGETRLETWVSYVLILGVLISLMLEAVGISLFYIRSHTVAISEDKSMFIHGRDFFTFLVHLCRETALSPTPIRLMALGIAILILTPYIRAIMSVLYFLKTRNATYAVITAFVLAVLTVSLIAH